MTTNILEHLENIKIFTDYINSKLATIDMFWNHIDKGGSIYKNRKFKFGVNENNYDPSDKELEKLAEVKKGNENKDLCEEYIKHIRNSIETSLDYDSAEISKIIEINNIYTDIIEAHGNLEEFLNTTKDIFDQYVIIIGKDLPEKFSNKLSQFEKVGKSNINELKINKNDSEIIEVTMRQKVEKAFGFMAKEDTRKGKLILNDNDFENLINWTTYYFENNFTLPQISKPIKEINTIKGNVAFTFKKFFKEEHPEKTYPESLFDLYQASFLQFRNDNISNFLKTSEPQYYKDLIKKVQ